MNEQLTPVKLTKTAVSKFLQWSTTRYNNYCGYGTKAENVDRVLKALREGNCNGEKTFQVECASPVGESGPVGMSHRSNYWRTKTSGDKYFVDCEAKTITALNSKRQIKFS